MSCPFTHSRNSGHSVPRRSSGALRIGGPRKRPAASFDRVVRPKKEPKEEEDEWPDMAAAEELSRNTLQPVPDDVADEWSRHEDTAAEVELQRRLLAEAERAKAQRLQEAAANAARRRIPPPPQPKPIDFVVIDPDSEEEAEYQRALAVSRWGDAGVGPSDPGAGPSNTRRDHDGSDDDDGGDYSQAIAASLGLQ